MKGQLGLESLVPITVAFVVVAFTIAIGTIILDEAGDEFCDGTWITNTTPATGLMKVNPATSASYGCCDTVVAGNNCSAWSDDASTNTSAYGNLSLVEMSEWLPTLALVVIAAIIIGVLITYLARGGGV